MVSAVGFLDLSLSKKIARRSVLFYMCTTISAVILGIILVLVIKPGTGAADLDEAEKKRAALPRRDVLTEDTLLDLIRLVKPANTSSFRYNYLIERCFASKLFFALVPSYYKNI